MNSTPGTTWTFRSPSGNVALLTFKGVRGGAAVMVADWHRSPSRKDARRLEAWLQESHGREFGRAFSCRIEDADARELAAQTLLYGGGMN